MTTPILGIPELEDGQIDQYLTANEAFRLLEEAGNDFVSVDLSAGSVTLTSAELAADAVFRSSGNAVPLNLTIPAEKRLFVVENGGSADLSIVRGSTTEILGAGSSALFYSDGTTDGLIAIASGGGGGGGSFTGGTLTSALNEAPIATLASASTVNIGAAAANTIGVTGTTTITAFDTIASGAVRRVIFSGILTLTHNGTSLILPTAASITTAAGDVAEFVSLGSGNWRCTGYERASGAALSGGGGGGGLTHFTEAVSTASPNATVPVVSLTATNAATNVDAALRPKGAGAVLAQIPDSTATGGDKRGLNAVDLQTMRSAADKVASGSTSTVSGGDSNKASGAVSTVSGGSGNEATGNYSFVGGGQNNDATGNTATAAGGVNNTASGQYSAVGGGATNTADGVLSFCPGGSNAIARSRYAAEAVASGTFSTPGDAQRARMVLRVPTSDATPAPVTANGTSASAINQHTMPNNSAYMFRAKVVARSSSDAAAYEITGLIRRGANAASTALEGTPTVTVIAESGGATAWDVAAVADTTQGALQIQVTGAAATNIKWVADVETVEVVG